MLEWKFPLQLVIEWLLSHIFVALSCDKRVGELLSEVHFVGSASRQVVTNDTGQIQKCPSNIIVWINVTPVQFTIRLIQISFCMLEMFMSYKTLVKIIHTSWNAIFSTFSDRRMCDQMQCDTQSVGTYFFTEVFIYVHCTNLNASNVKQILVKHGLCIPIKRRVQGISRWRNLIVYGNTGAAET